MTALARWVVCGCAALVMVAGCGAGSPGGTSSSGAASPQPTASSTPQASPSPTKKVQIAPCPTTPVAGPPHTLTLPASLDGWQIQQPQPYSAEPGLGPNDTFCDDLGQQAYYQNSQTDVITIEAGHHANLWKTNASFFANFWLGVRLTPYPPGPLGGQVDCAPSAEGPDCTWFDNDTWGGIIGAPDMTQNQAASLLLAFRAAIEHSG